MLDYADIEQNEDEWKLLRAPRITSSHLGSVMANYGKAFGEPAKKYAVDVALGQITGKVPANGYSNKDMERGHEQEPLARMEYEAQTFSTVKNGGFFYGKDIGCSPDGLVGDDGLIEIKSHIPSIHFDWIRKQTFNTTYRWQLLGNMKFTERKWIDYISFCPDFPEGKRIYVVRLHAKDFQEEFGMIDVRLNEFRALIVQTKKTILDSNYYIEAAA